jgi:hypothetical protein
MPFAIFFHLIKISYIFLKQNHNCKQDSFVSTFKQFKIKIFRFILRDEKIIFAISILSVRAIFYFIKQYNRYQYIYYQYKE